MSKTSELREATLDLIFSGDEIVLDWRNNTAQLNEKGVAKLFHILKEHGMVFNLRSLNPPDLPGMSFVEELDLKEKE